MRGGYWQLDGGTDALLLPGVEVFVQMQTGQNSKEQQSYQRYELAGVVTLAESEKLFRRSGVGF